MNIHLLPEEGEVLLSVLDKIVAKNWKNIFNKLIEQKNVSIEEILGNKETKVSNVDTVLEVLNNYLESTPFVIIHNNDSLILIKRDDVSSSKTNDEEYFGVTGQTTAHFQESHIVSYGIRDTSVSFSLPSFFINGNKEIVKHALESIISTSENTTLKERIDFENQSIDGIAYSIKEFIEQVQSLISSTLKGLDNKKKLSQKQEKRKRENKAHDALKLFQENAALILTQEQIIEFLGIKKNSINYIINQVLKLVEEPGYTIENIRGKGYIYGTKSHIALQKATLKPLRERKDLEKKEIKEKKENIPTRIFNFLIENIGKLYSQEDIAENVGSALSSLPVSQAQVKTLLQEYIQIQHNEENGQLLFENLRGKGWIIGTRERINIVREEMFGKKNSSTRKEIPRIKNVHISKYTYSKVVQRFYPLLRSKKGEIITKEEIITHLEIKENSLGYAVRMMKEVIEKENKNIEDESQRIYLENIRGVGYIYGTQAEIENLQKSTLSVSNTVRTPSKVQQLLNILLENRGKIYLSSNLVALVGEKKDNFSPLLAGLKKKIEEYNKNHGLKGAQEIEVHKTDRGAYVVGNYSETRDASNGLHSPISTPLLKQKPVAPKIEYSIKGLSLEVDIDISKFDGHYDIENSCFLGKPITSDQIALIYLIANNKKIEIESFFKYINTGEKNDKVAFLLTLRAQINNIFQGVFQIIVEKNIWYIKTSKKAPQKIKNQRKKPKVIKEKKERVTNANQLRDFFLQKPGIKLSRERLIEEIGMGDTSFNIALSKARKLIENTGRILSIHGGFYIYKPMSLVTTKPIVTRETQKPFSSGISPSIGDQSFLKVPVSSESQRSVSAPSINPTNKTDTAQFIEYAGELVGELDTVAIVGKNTDIEIDIVSQSINGVYFSRKNDFIFFMKLLEQRGQELTPGDITEEIDMNQLLLIKAHINNILKSENGYIHIKKGKNGFFIVQPDLKSESNYEVRNDVFSIGKDNLYIKYNGKIITGFSSEQIEILRSILKKKQRGVPYINYYRTRYESMKSIFERSNTGYRLTFSTGGKTGVRLLHSSEEVVGGIIQTKGYLLETNKAPALIERTTQEEKGSISGKVIECKSILYQEIEKSGIVHQYHLEKQLGDIVIDQHEFSLSLGESAYIIFLLLLSKQGNFLNYIEFGKLLGDIDESKLTGLKEYFKEIVKEIEKALRDNNTYFTIVTQREGVVLKKIEKVDPIKTISFGEKGDIKLDEEKGIIYWEKNEIETIPARTIEIILRLIKKYQKDGSTTINLSKMVKSGKNPETFFNPILSFIKESNLPFKLTNNGILSLKDGYLPR